MIIEEGGLWGCFSYSPVMVMISTMIYKLKKREVLGVASVVVVNNDDHDDNDDHLNDDVDDDDDDDDLHQSTSSPTERGRGKRFGKTPFWTSSH